MLGTILFLVVFSMLMTATETTADQKAPAESSMKGDSAQRACMDLGAMKEQDRHAMRELMGSDRGPDMMARMMSMARGMGNGDVMAGMTRMMDMMGSSGRDGMMGGQGGMMRPGPGSK
jgi:hypothetical protein